jgi:hypothetical protein
VQPSGGAGAAPARWRCAARSPAGRRPRSCREARRSPGRREGSSARRRGSSGQPPRGRSSTGAGAPGRRTPGPPRPASGRATRVPRASDRAEPLRSPENARSGDTFGDTPAHFGLRAGPPRTRNPAWRAGFRKVPPAGLEPATPGLGNRSGHLDLSRPNWKMPANRGNLYFRRQSGFGPSRRPALPLCTHPGRRPRPRP